MTSKQIVDRPTLQDCGFSNTDVTVEEDLSTTSQESCISFGTIEVREYNRVLGEDHIDVSNALAIGWEFEQQQTISVDEFEKLQQSKLDEALQKQWDATPACMRYRMQLLQLETKEAKRMCCERRRRILAAFGYTPKELAQAEKERIRRLKDTKKSVAKKSKEDVSTSTENNHNNKSVATRIIHKLFKPMRV